MTDRPKFSLSSLREIGWVKWDPVGVGGPEHGWPADEYDPYLLQEAGQVWNGHPDDEVADYLARLETQNIGLTARYRGPARERWRLPERCGTTWTACAAECLLWRLRRSQTPRFLDAEANCRDN